MMHSALQISRKIDYALRAVISMAEQADGSLVSFRQIAAIEAIPKDFLAKILRQLVEAGVVSSTRGARGGYCLARPASQISFLEVIEAVDGPIVLNLCLGENSPCDMSCDCSMLDVWRRAQAAMLDVFRTTSIADVRRSGQRTYGTPVDALLADALQ